MLSIDPLSRIPAEPGFFAGGGQLGALMRQKDWSRNPLGPVARWPQALKTAVRIMLTSRQAMFVWWGDELINLYNDAYRAILGDKHPQALGQPASVVWREIWDQVGPRAKTAMFENAGTYDESLLLIMERHGYAEETYYTFSYSPVPNDEGGTGGILCANTDDTQRIIGERQLSLLRELAANTADARTTEEACARSVRSLETNPRDLPFALIYLLHPDHRRMILAGAAGVGDSVRAAPETVWLDADSLWPLAEVLQSNTPRLITDLSAAGVLPDGAWGRPPNGAVVLPIGPSGQPGRSGALVAGLNPYRLYNDTYQGFLKLVSGQIAAAIANAQAYEEERQRAESLAELDRAKTAFFSNVSHEFRTPLTLMLGPLEEVLAKPAGEVLEDNRRMIDVAHRNGLRLLKLVNSLLDFSRIEAGRAQATYEPTNLAALTADLASAFRSTIEKAGLRFIVQCPPLPQPVYLDRDMWEKVVLNLISNAFKFTFEGEIAVEVKPSGGGTAVLEVRDTGTGIPAEELPRIFERFHRAEGTRGRTHEGTGIGLALIHELVKLHGGSVAVESEVGKGSTFRVQLPFGDGHLPQERIGASSSDSTGTRTDAYVEEAEHWLPIAPAPSAAGASQPSTVPYRILLADDNADMREYVRRLLDSRYEVTPVANGEDALNAALSQPPDLVLSDVMMPGLDGFGLVNALRAHPQTRTVPVILLSARAGEESRIEGLQSGADDYLVKPFTARELLARVDTHLHLSRLRQDVGQALFAAEERLRLAVECTDLGTWDHDLLTDQVVCSERFKAMCGLPPNAPCAIPVVTSRMHPEDRERTFMEYQQMLGAQTGESFQSEFRVLWPDGTVRWMFAKGKALFQQAGVQRQPVRVVGTLMDVTDRRHSEESLREMQKLESLGLLAGGIAHDFNNLLTGVIGNAGVLEDEFPPASPQAEATQRLMEAANGMARLTSQMLAYSGRGRFIVEPINLSRHVVQIVSLIQASIPKSVELRLSLDNNLPAIEADASQLQQVIMNLVINAAEAIDPNQGVVEVKTAVGEVGEEELRADVARQGSIKGEYVVLSVTDDGHGMDSATLARIFDPFFTTKFTGRGLGLAAVVGIVRGHHGLLTVESRPGAGTTFRVFFPTARARHPAATPVGPVVEQGSGTILVVDDEGIVRSTAKVVLSRAGYHVFTARNGQEAARVFAASPDDIDLVLLDMTMPVMGGEETLDRLIALRPNVVVLASSGYDEREAKQRFGRRIAGFLQKPYTAAQLTAKVGKLLRMP